MPTGYPTRPEGLIDRIEISLVHLREAYEELNTSSRTVREHSEAAWAQIRGSLRFIKLASEAAGQAKTTLEGSTTPIEHGFPRRRGR